MNVAHEALLIDDVFDDIAHDDEIEAAKVVGVGCIDVLVDKSELSLVWVAVKKFTGACDLFFIQVDAYTGTAQIGERSKVAAFTTAHFQHAQAGMEGEEWSYKWHDVALGGAPLLLEVASAVGVSVLHI